MKFKNILYQIFVKTKSSVHGIIPDTQKFVSKRTLANRFMREMSSLKLDPDLHLMLDHFFGKRLYEQTSKMWVLLMQIQVRKLSNIEFKDFYYHIGKNYCLRFMDLERISASFLSRLDTVDLPSNVLLQRQPHLSYTQSTLYNLTTILMYQDFKSKNNISRLDNIKQIESNFLQNQVSFDGRLLSQDVLQSINEISWIEDKVPTRNATILEIGAGYGRIPYIFFSEGNIKKYINVDIPPALLVSQLYLTNIFPDKKIFRFRPFDNFSVIQKEFEEADLVFLAPDQFELLPAKSVDIVIGINCFQEMLDEQIKSYFNLINLISSFLYLKASEAPHNVYSEHFLPLKDYPFKSGWEVIERRNCEIPLDYSEVLVKL